MRVDDLGWPAIACLILAWLSLMAMPVSVALSALQWLMHGYGWTTTMAEMLANLGYAYPATKWVGLQRLLDWYMQQKAYWAAPILLFAGFYILSWVAEFFREDIVQAKAEREAKKAQSKNGSAS